MRKFGNAQTSKAASEALITGPGGAGERVSDSAVVGEYSGHKITGKDVREAQEFADMLDSLAALYKYAQTHPEDKEAVERLTLTVQYVQEHHLYAFLDVSLGLWEMYRRANP